MQPTHVQRAQWADLMLARLERLCHLEQRFVTPPDVVTDPQRLVCKAIFATYCDCVLLGRKDEAERLLAGRTPAPEIDISPPPQAEPTH